MSAHLRYLLYVLRHKYHVLVAGRRLGVPLWRLIVHDWSKFTRAEWGPYVRRFYGGGGNDEEFRAAWLHHVQENPHHWEHWSTWCRNKIAYGQPATLPALKEALPILGGVFWGMDAEEVEDVVRPMPETYAREMVADWIGAGRAQGKDDLFRWWHEKRDRMILHPETRQKVNGLVYAYHKRAVTEEITRVYRAKGRRRP